jgi:Uma2 family endonuclease
MTEVAAQLMPMTITEYLAYADAHPRQRFELLAGVPVAMAPATRRHQIISGNIDRGLARQVRDRGCETLRDFGLAESDEAEFMPQPDVMVRCGPMPGRKRWASDAVVVLEVLSPSTMADDRGYKLQQYLGVPTLRHVALVYQDECRIEHWSRGVDGGWTESPQVLNRMQDAIEFSAVGATLPLSAIYDDVTFD